MPALDTIFITGAMKPRTRANPRLCSWKWAFILSKLAISAFSSAYALTTVMPARFSCARADSAARPSCTLTVRSISVRDSRFTIHSTIGYAISDRNVSGTLIVSMIDTA